MTEPRMSTRRGEQLGWLLGWAGGFLWIIALALLFLWRGQWLVGLLGLVLAGLGYAAVVFFRPWRSPRTRYWRLMLLPYVAMLGGVPWAIWGFGPEQAESLNAWQALIILPVLSPFISIGWRCWEVGDCR
ncbi:hypothetical protein U5801_27370 [Lamprobacter modestohalophilus]|uniref:hypothetical protein n=1 Tax=Lamprobacter modestohalophilus TaxID=1064514 RepID=UPI002ADEA66A|nr:hypothetical protein [Lamprobacter modestohalophilus]MEA1053496.1 hypothetical protein [Lamprobacter modestohalophilus]